LFQGLFRPGTQSALNNALHYGIFNNMQKKVVKRRISDEDRKKNQIVIRITDWELRTLNQISELEGMANSFLVREGLWLVFQKYAKDYQSPKGS
jgi:hypothetical protein